MSRFSDRIGVTTPPALARDGMSDHLKTALWNKFQPLLFHIRDNRFDWVPRLKQTYEYLHWRTHELLHNQPTEVRKLNEWVFSAHRQWYEIYNFTEFLAGLLARESGPRVFMVLNAVLEDEGSMYRFVDGVLTTVTDPTELEAVTYALAVSDKFAGARVHLGTALSCLGRRPEPDFRNAIKEAISAVESTLKILTGRDHADLAEALRDFTRARPVHGALFKGLDSLYGYTSNEHGLRHALLEADANVGFAEAKFIIVACAAFMSFLIAKAMP